MRVSGPGGIICEIWVRKSVPGVAPVQQLGVTYPQLQEGTLVGVVDAKGTVALRKVSVGRNFGADVELLDGITDTDRMVLNPPDWLADGQTVQVAPPASAASAASAASPGATAKAPA